jgi:gluconate 5-dehydrogenase
MCADNTMPVALVTGATGGIGSAIVARLVRAGYHVLALGRDAQKLAALRDAYGSAVTTQAMDIFFSEPTWRKATMQNLLEPHGRCDVLVCAHGAPPVTQPTADLPVAKVLEALQVDAVGALVACQAVYPLMAQQRHGSIVLISSLHARQTYPARVPYCMAKSAVCGLARALAVEWGLLGIRTNVLLPWQTVSPRHERFVEEAHQHGEDLLGAYLQRSPMRNLVTPAQIADAALHCITNEALNGCEIPLDTGVSASMWYRGFETPVEAR